MSSAQHLRDFARARLDVALEDIVTVFQETIDEYEEEIGRQRRLLDVFRKPGEKFHRIDLPQQFVCKEEETLSERQICSQEGDSSVKQEDA